jgi:excisionase family DNA binding protein
MWSNRPTERRIDRQRVTIVSVIARQMRLLLLLQIALALAVAAPVTDRLWSLPETAAFLGVPEATLYQWASRGTGPKSYRVGRFRRYKAGDVHAWLERQASGQTA